MEQDCITEFEVEKITKRLLSEERRRPFGHSIKSGVRFDLNLDTNDYYSNH
jgi:hypothetical protein